MDQASLILTEIRGM